MLPPHPEPEQTLLLQRLALDAPAQRPPKVTTAEVTSAMAVYYRPTEAPVSNINYLGSSYPPRIG
jgi:hypothetical protein